VAELVPRFPDRTSEMNVISSKRVAVDKASKTVADPINACKRSPTRRLDNQPGERNEIKQDEWMSDSDKKRRPEMFRTVLGVGRDQRSSC